MFLTDVLLAVLYPQSCRICGGSVERRRFGVACEACWRKQIYANEEPINAKRTIGFYEGALRESILVLKRQPHLPQHLVDLIFEAGRRFEVTRIVPVPLHEERLRSRGFNQAAMAMPSALARATSAAASADATWTMCTRALNSRARRAIIRIASTSASGGRVAR